jgi:hypothetical protein
MEHIIPPQECYQHLGFKLFEGDGEFVPAELWRKIQDTPRLDEIRQRYLLRRDRVGQPIVHEGYVIGTVTPNTLHPEEVEKLLSALTEGMARGCQTLKEWQEMRRAKA